MTRSLAKLEEWVDKRLWIGVTQTERKLLQNYKIALDEIRKELGKVYEKYAKGGVLTHAEMTKYHRLKNLHDQVAGIMGPTLSKNGKLVEKLTEVQYEESFFLHAWAFDQATGAALRWGLLNEAAVKAAVEGQGWREVLDITIKGLHGDTLRTIDRTIAQGLIKGSSYENMARALKKNVEVSAAKARMIAQNEAARAQVLGQIDNYNKAEDLGINLKRTWEATLDDRTRPEHAALDGEEADENGLFHTAAGNIAGPKLSGEAWFDYNCRCRITGEIEGYESKSRWARDEGTIPYTKFRDWAKERGLSRNIYGKAY